MNEVRITVDLSPDARAALDRLCRALSDHAQVFAEAIARCVAEIARTLETAPPMAVRTEPPAHMPEVSGAIGAPHGVAPPETPRATVARPSPASSAARVWSEERKEVLRREYPAGTPRAAILARINALPGPNVTPDRMSVQAANMGLRRPGREVARDAAAPVETDHATALRWGAERGLDPHRLDLDAVNAKRRALGLPEFIVPDGRRAA